MASAPEPEDNVAPLYHYPIVVPCDLCETKDDVNSFCRNCSQNLCDGCKRLHLRSTVSRDHNVVHISEGKSSDSEAKFCVKHGERLFFYCRTCSVLFCPKCLSPNHKTHDFLDTDEYAKELQSKVAMVIEEKSKKLDKSRQNVLHIEESKKKYADTYTNYKRYIMNTANYLHKEVDRVQEELLSTITNYESQGLSKFDEVIIQEKSKSKELQDSLDKLIRHSKKHDNISLVACVDKIIDNCSESIQHITSFGLPVVEFKALRISKDAVSKLFGTLQYSDAEFSGKYAENTKKLPKPQMEKPIYKSKSVYQQAQLNKSKNCSCIRDGRKNVHLFSECSLDECRLCKKPLGGL